MAAILLADDDQSTRDLVRRALEADGHAVTIAQDGNEALEKVQAGGRIDVLLTDVHMPGIDGIELAAKAIASTPELRVLLMSGFSSELDRAKKLQAARLGAIEKPFTLEQPGPEAHPALRCSPGLPQA